jgi:hypothetical protein
LRTARGFKACDANDKEIGVFETPAAGIVALLEAATDAAASRTFPRRDLLGSEGRKMVSNALIELVDFL